MIIGALLFTSLPAQTIKIRLLNGETGKAMPNRMVKIVWAEKMESTVVTIGADGMGNLQISAGLHQFLLSPGPKPGSEPNRVAYIDCNESGTEMFQVEQVLAIGVVPKNQCGTHTTVPKPGEIVFWAKPIPWWLPDLQ